MEPILQSKHGGFSSVPPCLRVRHSRSNRQLSIKETGGPKAARYSRTANCGYFIIAAATFLNALTSASMWASVYVGCVQKEIVESASACATSQLNFV